MSQRKCYVENCDSSPRENQYSEEKITLFKVPKDDGERDIWSQILLSDLQPSYYICEKHFDKQAIFFTKNECKRLKKGARPISTIIENPFRVPENPKYPLFHSKPVITSVKKDSPVPFNEIIEIKDDPVIVDNLEMSWESNEMNFYPDEEQDERNTLAAKDSSFLNIFCTTDLQIKQNTKLGNIMGLVPLSLQNTTMKPVQLRDPSEKQSIYCSICQKEFTTHSLLVKHSLAHKVIKTNDVKNSVIHIVDSFETLHKDIQLLKTESELNKKQLTEQLEKLATENELLKKKNELNEKHLVNQINDLIEEINILKNQKQKELQNKSIKKEQHQINDWIIDIDCDEEQVILTDEEYLKDFENRADIDYDINEIIGKSISNFLPFKTSKLKEKESIYAEDNSGIQSDDVFGEEKQENSKDLENSIINNAAGDFSEFTEAKDFKKVSAVKKKVSLIKERKERINMCKTEKGYKCNICLKDFLRRDSFRRHLKTHEIVKESVKIKPTNKCNVCNKVFSRVANLRHHIQIHFPREANYKCDVCSKKFLSKQKLVLHLKVHNEVHVCTFCFKEFNDYTLYRNHLKDHSGEDRYYCGVCHERFDLLYYRNLHVNTKHFDDNNFKCDICNEVLESSVRLDYHVRGHFNFSLRYLCDYCNKEFTMKKLLRNHIQGEHVEGLFYCKFCLKGFSSEEYLLNFHMGTHTGHTNYECSICKKGFQRKCHLEKHKVRHTDEPFKCRKCNEVFTRNKDLRFHLHTVHFNKEVLKCDSCNKPFLSTKELNIHKRTHTREQPDKKFLCSYCGKYFISPATLDKHILVLHTNVKTFECDYCQQLFPHKHKLQRHIFGHTGYKPFVCHICGKGCTELGNLKNHFWKHTGYRPKKCDICKKGFDKNKTFLKHMSKYHPEKPV